MLIMRTRIVKCIWIFGAILNIVAALFNAYVAVVNFRVTNVTEEKQDVRSFDELSDIMDKHDIYMVCDNFKDAYSKTSYETNDEVIVVFYEDVDNKMKAQAVEAVKGFYNKGVNVDKTLPRITAITKDDESFYELHTWGFQGVAVDYSRYFQTE